jgi:hypothetical protein
MIESEKQSEGLLHSRLILLNAAFEAARAGRSGEELSRVIAEAELRLHRPGRGASGTGPFTTCGD